MASDSSETQTDIDGQEQFVEVDKTLYFKPLNIGISTWGKADIPPARENINTWLHKMIEEFIILNPDSFNHALVKLTKFLALKLDQAFTLKKTVQNNQLSMGLHIAGYNSTESTLPGICHVYIEPGRNTFDSQITLQYLPKHIPAYHLRNGIYKEFALFWPTFSGVDETFRTLIQSKYSELIRNPSNSLLLRAEWLGNWVRQMCFIFKTAGLPEYIGKSVKILTFCVFRHKVDSHSGKVDSHSAES
jgi:hypothetical protein